MRRCVYDLRRDNLRAAVNRLFPQSIFLLFVSALGCIAEPVPVLMPPAVNTDGGIRVLPPVRPESFSVDVRSLMETQPDKIFTLSDGALLTQTGTSVSFMAALGTSETQIDHSFPDIVAAEALPWGAVVIWTVEAFYVWEEGQVEWSPISDVIPAEQSGSLLVAPGPEGKKDLWISAADGLRLWRNGEAFTIRPDAISTQNAKLAFGAPWEGQAALWFASGDSVYALVGTGTITQARQSLAGFKVDQIVVDFEGTVWVLSEGRLLSRSWENEWLEHTGLGEIRAISGHPDTVQLWISTVDDGIWSHRGGVFQPIAWKDETISLSDVGTSTGMFSGFPGGQALVESDGAVYVLTPGRYVEILGLEEGQLLTSTVTIEIQVSEPQTVDSIEVFVDETPVAALSVPQKFEISPEGLADGTHQVTARVTYSDGAPSSRVDIRVSVYRQMLPRWGQDILPIFQSDCEVCHGIRGSARLLNTPQLWRSNIDRVLNAVRNGTMPLPPSPPLSDQAVEKIEGWRAVGYLE